MELRDHVKQYLNQNSSFEVETVEEVVDERRRRNEMTPAPSERPAVAEVWDKDIGSEGRTLTVRRYKPVSEEPLPVVIFFHGGGFAVGSLETHDTFCRVLANELGAYVVAVDYRLAPKYPFPSGVYDCLDAVRWVLSEYRDWSNTEDRFYLCGDSAGANIVYAASTLLRKEETYLEGQMLLYPVADFYNREEEPAYVSYHRFSEGYGLTAKNMGDFWAHYLSAWDERRDPLAVPMRDEEKRDNPPTLIITAEYDVLRDEGEELARQLKEANADVHHHRVDGTIHGFISHFPLEEDGQEAMNYMRAFVQKHIGK